MSPIPILYHTLLLAWAGNRGQFVVRDDLFHTRFTDPVADVRGLGLALGWSLTPCAGHDLSSTWTIARFATVGLKTFTTLAISHAIP